VTYSTLLQSEKAIKEGYLAVLIPRRRVTNWAVYSGFVYSTSYDLGDIEKIEENGVELVEAFNTTLTAGQYYHDTTNDVLYLRTLQSADPDTVQIGVHYKIYVATTDAYFYSDPLDDTTSTVYYEPLIKDSPDIKSTTSDSLFGSLPVQTSNIKLINAEHLFERHIYESSFHKAIIKVYHWVDEILVDNLSLIYNGLMNDISYDTSEIQIKCVDRVDQFSEEYRNPDTSFFAISDFANLEPNMVGKPIRYVYGLVKGFVPVNVDYVSENQTTSDNRDYVVMAEQTGVGELSRPVAASPASTTTRTYLTFSEGFNIGDTVWFDRSVGTDEYREITNINYLSGYIEHDALTHGAMTSADSVKRGFVSRIEIIQDNITYLCYYNRDYTCSNAMAADTSGFSFSTSLEANIVLPRTLSPNDKILCTVYGRVNDLTANAITFGANDTELLIITNPIMVLYDILKSRIGIPESEINLTDFATVRTATATEAIGLSIPKNKSSNFPKYKDIILDILQTSLLRIFIDNNQKWTVAQFAPLGTVDKEIESDDIFMSTFSYDFNYGEIVSDIIIQYNRREADSVTGNEAFNNSTFSSDYAKYIHKVDKQKTLNSLHFRSDDADVLAERLSYALCDRIGTITFTTNRKFFDTKLNDVVTIGREKLPNYAYVEGTTRTVDGSIVDISKSLGKVTVRIEDQKGVQDNEGNW